MSDYSRQVYAFGASVTDGSGTITAGGTAQNIFAANNLRRYLLVQNQSAGNLWINFGTPAVEGQPSILLVPNGSVTFEGMFVPDGSVSIIGATTGQAFCAKEG